ncbi:MAG: GumC family protein [Fimbriimonas sp.]
MVRAYGFRIALFGTVGLLIGLLIALLTPPKYEAIMQILVDGRPFVSGRPMTEADDQVADLLESTGPRTVQTQVEQLTGFGVLTKAAEAVAQRQGKNPNAIPDFADLQDLARSVVIEAVQGSDVVTLRVRLSSRALSEDFATEMYNAFYQQNVQNAREAGQRAIESLEGQEKQAKASLDAVDKEMEAFRTAHGFPSIELKITAENRSEEAARELVDQARMELAGTEASVAGLRNQLANTDKTIESTANTGVNGNFQQIEAALAEARVALRQLLVTWEEGAQPVIAARERIARLETELRQQKEQMPVGTSRAPNPVYQTLQGQLATAEASLGVARTRFAHAQANYAKRQRNMSALPELQRKLEEMERRQDTYNRIYQTFKQRLDTLRLAERGRLTTPTIVTPALSFPKPVSPNYALNLGAGTIAGLLLGLLSAFNTESRRSPIRTLSQLNRLTLEPAFRAVPELPFVGQSVGKQPDDVFVGLLGNFVRSTKRPYRVGVMGVDRDAGASVTSASMALAAALEGHATLMVDTGRDKGAAARLGAQEEGGPLTVLKTAGEDLVNLNGLVERIRGLEATQALTVFDLQPFRSGSNPILFIAGLDECVLLVRAGRTRTVDFLQAQQMLLDAGIPQVTVVLSRARSVDDDFTFLPPDAAGPALGGPR